MVCAPFNYNQARQGITCLGSDHRLKNQKRSSGSLPIRISVYIGLSSNPIKHQTYPRLKGRHPRPCKSRNREGSVACLKSS